MVLLSVTRRSLVAKGYIHTYSVDYSETLSSITRLNSIRIFFPVVVNRRRSIFQLDVKNAFLYSDLDEEVFIDQPPGYVTRDEIMCRLKKAIYSLKQSPRALKDFVLLRL